MTSYVRRHRSIAALLVLLPALVLFALAAVLGGRAPSRQAQVAATPHAAVQPREVAHLARSKSPGSTLAGDNGYVGAYVPPSGATATIEDGGVAFTGTTMTCVVSGTTARPTAFHWLYLAPMRDTGHSIVRTGPAQVIAGAKPEHVATAADGGKALSCEADLAGGTAVVSAPVPVLGAQR
jgi:hypothetical protein